MLLWYNLVEGVYLRVKHCCSTILALLILQRFSAHQSRVNQVLLLLTCAKFVLLKALLGTFAHYNSRAQPIPML